MGAQWQGMKNQASRRVWRRHAKARATSVLKRKCLRSGAAGIALILLINTALISESSVLRAQEVTATLTGIVTDPSNAAISGTRVTATDRQRGSVWTTQTNEQGVYNLTRLPIGTYDLKVEARGFQSLVQSGIRLELNQTARVDARMSIGSVSESMDIDSAAPLLQTQTTQMGTVIDSRTSTTLPLATRNYLQLTLLAPGSVHPNPSSFKNGQTTGGSGRPYINGNREQANNFILDGVDNNQVSDNLVGYTPNIDAIQEFNLISQNASAEFGNFMGGIVNTYIKSGTNAFHGDLFELFRNDVLNANEWSKTFQGADKSKLRWNMFGGTLGGPLKRDKLFFFADYQGQRLDNPSIVSGISVLTASERRGDFSELLRLSTPVQLYDPTSIPTGADGKAKRSPFANNQIPASIISPVAARLVASTLYPMPTQSGLTNNIFNIQKTRINSDQGDIKVDYDLSDKNRLFARYSRSQVDNPSTNSLPLLSVNTTVNYPVHNAVLNWIRTISPRFVNEARIGLNRVLLYSDNTDSRLSGLANQIGLQGISNGFPSLELSGSFASNIGARNNKELFADTVIQYEDTTIVTNGSYTIRAGFQGWRQRLNTSLAGSSGATGFLRFDGRYTAGPSALAIAGHGAGAAEADLLLGLPHELGRSVTTGTSGQRSNILAAYGQDDWQAGRTLIINLGFRWELHTPWVEVNDRQTNFAPFTGEIELAGRSNYYRNNRALYNQYNGAANFQPRVGFAWMPDPDRAVVRGAYTISSYLEGTGTNLRLFLNPPFNEDFDTKYDSLSYPRSNLSQGLSAIVSPTDPFAGANVRLWDPNVRPAVSQQWNFTVQCRFGKYTTLQAAYLGQHVTHLMVPMPYFQRRLLPGGGTAQSPYLSGNPALANIGRISGTESNSNQRYDAFQATLQKRLGQGLQYQVAYTYEKCLTDSIGFYGSFDGQATPASAYWQNLYDRKAEWGPCYYDVTHVLSSYAIYRLPLGRNRKFGAGLNRALNGVVGDWQISGIVSLHGGFPLTISGPDASGTNSRGPRANCLAPARVFGEQDSPQGGFQWFDPSSYGAPAPGSFGTCGVGTVRGPGLHTLDLSLQKQFPFTETTRLEFRGEFINLTNTPIFNSPNSTLGSILGLLQSSQGARNIQLGIKLYF